MEIYKCGMPGCNEYISEDELKRVKYNNKIINVCTICDDGNYEPVNGGEHIDTIKKTEKIRRKRNRED